MNKDLNEKIKILNNINSNDSRFIVKVLEAYIKKDEDFEKDKKNCNIILKCNLKEPLINVIDLDKIWAKPYFYTKMRLQLTNIFNKVCNTKKDEFERNHKKLCKDIIYSKAYLSQDNSKGNLIDIVEFIKKIEETQVLDFVFIANALDEETIFKYKQLSLAFQAIKIKDKLEKYSFIYDEVYSFLQNDFIANNYCDFQNNKCVAQRRLHTYPIPRTDGCCFKRIKKCEHLDNGNCKVECLPCRLFSCPYLTKRGIGYWAHEFVLLKAFFNNEQRKVLVLDFHKGKSEILNKLL